MDNPATEQSPGLSAWAWWEGRRLRYNIGLFVAGWIGFAIQSIAMAWLWQTYSVGSDLITMALLQGLIYLLYMAGANVLYLIGAFLEGALRPDPVSAYRAGAWRLGFWASVGLPVVVAIVITAMFVSTSAFGAPI